MTALPRAQKATRKKLKLKLGLPGPTGSGKTLTALLIMSGIVGPNGRILLVDTENGSASIYSEDPTWNVDFDTIDLRAPFAPSLIAEAVKRAEDEGYDGLILDGISPFWNAEGGTISIAEAGAKKKSDNRWAGWSDATPEQVKMMRAIVDCRVHLIATMRANSEWIQVPDDRKPGKTKPVEIGLKPIQDKEAGYEFTIIAMMNGDGNVAQITKTRCWQLQGQEFTQPGREFGKMLVDWLQKGIDPPPPPPSPEIFQRQMAALGFDTTEKIIAVKERLGLSGYTPEMHYEHLALIRASVEAAKDAPAEQAAPEPAPTLTLVTAPVVEPTPQQVEPPVMIEPPPAPAPQPVTDTKPAVHTPEEFQRQCAEIGLDSIPKIAAVKQRLNLPAYTPELHDAHLAAIREYVVKANGGNAFPKDNTGAVDLAAAFAGRSSELDAAAANVAEQINGNGHPVNRRRQQAAATA